VSDELDAVTDAAERARAATLERDRRIVAAVAAGAGQRAVARAAGMSHTAVQYIVRRESAA
jgi:FixJ family two-component response regulator